MYYYVGQKVSHQEYGNGVVNEINNNCIRQIIVLFDSGRERPFTLDGKTSTLGEFPSLSQQPHIPLKLEEIVNFEKGELVWVKDFYQNEWVVRYYSHQKERKYYCFLNQKKNGAKHGWEEIRKFSDIPF